MNLQSGVPTKNQILKEITDLLKLEEVSVTAGSSIPSVFFSEVAAEMGIPIVSGMPAMARKIIENSGLSWSENYSSENSPSGGGSTVTVQGLLQLKKAVQIWLGHDPEEIPKELHQWIPDPKWKEKRGELDRILTEKINRPNADQFRETVLDVYGSKCAISGINTIEAIEIAHIVPYYGTESDHVQNAIPLRSDLHKLFDRGLLGIIFNENTSLYEITIDTSILDDYGQFDGGELLTPSDPSFQPSRVALMEHIKSVQGN